ncbi:hypothetical protein C8K30_1011030 [Promicromonospora sp. AC04]|uniref:hypothetical protein n=1 Tax=Promicromonospora sp. AC04 TaxID=2135723 RepID=UPI000D39B699|nr:hypothetical protein [Promicromonospora sp. AC04]PUB32504.1 hypothetical protein C8K30_1011030 [Promicromonospora sp. AC04]
MLHPPEAHDCDEFRGFDEARRILWCHEARARVRERLELTTYLLDAGVAAVYVDNFTRADRDVLAAFDADGRQVSTDTLYVDEPEQRLEVAVEFDHDFTGLMVPAGSQLAQAVAREDGWIIDMSVLRDYDLVADRRAAQRAMFMAHLQDMMKTGQARGFLIGWEDGRGDADAA